MNNTVSADQIRAVIKQLDIPTPILDHFWYEGYEYTRTPIYQGWYRTGYQWTRTKVQHNNLVG